MKKLVLFLILCTAALIFLFSSQEAKDSDKVSTDVTQKIVSALSSHKDLTWEEIQKKAEELNETIRKYAHFVLFAVLGLLVFLLLVLYDLPVWKALLWSVFLCFLYACSDEIHQIFVPGRSCQISDVGIDSLGAFTGSVLMLGVKKLKTHFWDVKNSAERTN